MAQAPAQKKEVEKKEKDATECKEKPYVIPKVHYNDLSFGLFVDNLRLYLNKKCKLIVVTKEFWDQFIKEFQYLKTQNLKEMKKGPNPQLRTKHVYVALFAIAVKRAMVNLKLCSIDSDDGIELITKIISESFEFMLKTLFKGFVNKLKRSQDPWKDFRDYCYNGTMSEYGTFDPQFIKNDDKGLFWNFHKCTFTEICILNKEPLVAPMLCDYDFILSKMISPWVTFKRESTIACGGKCCTFRYGKNKEKNGIPDIEDWMPPQKLMHDKEKQQPKQQEQKNDQ